MRIHSTQALIICFFCLIFLNGCAWIPKEMKQGHELTAGVRMNSNGQIAEQIIAVPTEHHYYVPFGAEGGSDDYIGNRTWRFYTQTEDGKRKPLSFLKTKAENVFSPWVLIEPLSYSNLWIAVMFEGEVLPGEKCNFRIVFFNSSKKLNEQVITCSGDQIEVEASPYNRLTSYYLPNSKEPMFKFDSVKNLLIYKTRGAEMQYDPLKSSR